MTLRSQSGLRRVLCGTSAFALLALGGGAFAQTQTQTQAEESQLDDVSLEEITVTGSRIKRNEYEMNAPIVAMEAEVMFQRGLNTVADALNELPAFGIPANNNQGNQAGGAVGQQVVDFLGLGSSRTLVVIDGKRMVSQAAPGVFTGGSQIDLNIIPRGLIERVETLTVGGSAIYGTDAIAGTVNIILKDDFEGLEIDTEGAITQKGDGADFQVGILGGGNFADGRGNAVVSLEFTNTEGILQSDRPKVFTGSSFVGNAPFPPDGFNLGLCTPDCDRIWITSRTGLPVLGPQGLPLPGAGAILDSQGRPLQFSRSGTGDLVPFNTGTLVGGAFAQGGDGDTIRDFNSAQNDQERFNFYGKVNYNLTDHVKYNLETLISLQDSTQLISQPFIQSGGFGFEEQALPIRLDNAFLSPEARATLAAGTATAGPDGGPLLVDADGDGTPETPGFFLARFSSDVLENAPFGIEQLVYTFRTGFEGDFTLFDRTFDWDVTYTFGRTETDTEDADVIDPFFFNALDAVRLTDEDAALINTNLANVLVNTFSGGDIACRATLDAAQNGLPRLPGGFIDDDFARAAITGCVPINLFGEGAPSDEARAFVTGNINDEVNVQQHIVTGSISAELFEMPWNSGAFSFAMGFEHRREKSNFLPGGFSEVGLSRSAPVPAILGEFRVNEGFWEGLVPVVTPDMDVPFVDSFEVDGAARYVANNRAGDDRTWTAGGRIRFDLPGIGNSLMFRGNFTRSARAPGVTELFEPLQTQRAFITDPCDNRIINQGSNRDVRRRNCEAAFAAAVAANNGQDFDVDLSTPGLQTGLDNFRSIITNQSQPIQQGGSPDLQNETADSFTLGVVFTPEFVPGLNLTVDWIDVEVSNVIFNISGTVAATTCFDDNDFDRFCDRITRADNFQIVNALATPANIGFIKTQRLLASANYQASLSDFGLPDWGDFRINVGYQYNDQLDISVLGDGSDLNREDGEFDDPEHELNASITYFYGPFSFFWQSLWQSSTIFNRDEAEEQRREDSIGGGSLHNMSISYNITDDITFRTAVSNVFDREPTILEQITTGSQSGNESPIFDVLGRRFDFGLRFRF